MNIAVVADAFGFVSGENKSGRGHVWSPKAENSLLRRLPGPWP